MPALSTALPFLLSAALAAAEPPASPPQAHAPPPSIDSILQGLGPDQSTDAPDEAAPGPLPGVPVTPPPSGPVPYSQADVRAYDQAIRAAAQTSEGRQGPLDGGWTVSSRDGLELYRFRFSDKGFGLTLAEGAWRDLRAARVGGSGFVSSVGYDGEKLMFRFYEAGPDDLVVVTVRQSSAGQWTGELWRGGAVTLVTFKRN